MSKEMAHQYAVDMEHIFRKIHPDIPLDADSFDIHPREALEDGLGYLLADGLIQKEDFSEMLETYDFGDENLTAFFNRPDGKEQYEELIRRISNIVNRSIK